MATKQPNQKSSSQIPQQKDQNAVQPPKDQKPAANQPAPAAKDGKSSAQIPAQGKDAKDNTKDVKDNKNDQKDNKNAAQTQQNQGSKANLQVQQNDPNSRKASTTAVPSNQLLQPENTQASRASISKDLQQNTNQTQESQPAQNAVGNKNPNANSNLMGNFFDSFDPTQQQTQQADLNDETDLKDEEDENLKPIPTDDPKELERRKKQAEMFKKYLDNTGVSMAFQIIYAEILAKKINQENVFGYTAMRLRQIGNDLSAISNKVKK